MKKSALKLKLNRETLRALEQAQLEEAAGGATLSGCVVTKCFCSVSCTC